MYYPISIGLDVHLHSISACAFNVDTGEINERKFLGDDYPGIVAWVSSFDEPAQAVYESGFCGFTLKRTLDSLGVPCKIAAISKLAKPTGDKVKTDKRDAAFLARQLACKNITEVHVPSIDREGLRDLSRALGIIRDNLIAAKHRVVQTHHRYGLKPKDTKTKGAWTLPWLTWAKSLEMPSKGAQLAYDTHIQETLRLIDEKKRLEKLVTKLCSEDALRYKVAALMSIKGISQTVAFCLVTEIGEFSRFNKPGGFAAFLGLVPSESSSGEKKSRGNITRTGNEYVRKSLTEAAWCYARIKTAYKKPDDLVSPEIAALAYKANTRLFARSQILRKTKKPCVANVAITRELACWVWAITVLVERSVSVT